MTGFTEQNSQQICICPSLAHLVDALRGVLLSQHMLFLVKLETAFCCLNPAHSMAYTLPLPLRSWTVYSSRWVETWEPQLLNCEACWLRCPFSNNFQSIQPSWQKTQYQRAKKLCVALGRFCCTLFTSRKSLYRTYFCFLELFLEEQSCCADAECQTAAFLQAPPPPLGLLTAAGEDMEVVEEETAEVYQVHKHWSKMSCVWRKYVKMSRKS